MRLRLLVPYGRSKQKEIFTGYETYTGNYEQQRKRDEQQRTPYERSAT
jgi:hypothetical protein